MTFNEGIKVEEVNACSLCGERGHVLHRGLRAQWAEFPGVWTYSRCPGCGFVWLSPRPVREELHRMYETYYTHTEEEGRGQRTSLGQKLKSGLFASAEGYSSLAKSWTWLQLGRLLSLIPPLREIRALGLMCFDGRRKGRLLDIGCGSGRFLALMRDAGWQVFGVEPDAAAAKLAQEHFGIPVVVGSLVDAKVPDHSFDAIAMNHVIEHVHDPLELLRECCRALRVGGRLTVVTPNIESLGHGLFRDSWLHLDPGRHLHLFSLKTLRYAAERSGLHVLAIRTSERGAWWVWQASRAVRSGGTTGRSGRAWLERMGGLGFHAGEELLRMVRRNIGEELVLIATRGCNV